MLSANVTHSFNDKYHISDHVSISYLRNYCSISTTNRVFFYPNKDTLSDSFFFSFNVSETRFYDLQIENYSIRLYLTPGDSLHGKIDLDNGQANFTGKGKDANNYLAGKYFNKGTSVNRFIAHRKEYKKLSPPGFYQLCDSIYQTWNYGFRSFPGELFKEKFGEYAKNDMLYELANEQYSYLKTHFKERMLAGEPIGPDSSYYWFLADTKPQVPTEMQVNYYNGMRTNLAVTVNNAKAVNSGYYFRFLDNYINDLMPEYAADKHWKIKGLENQYLHQYRLAKEHFNGKVADVLLGRILVNAFASQQENTMLMDSLMTDYGNHTTDTSCLNTVKAKFQEYLKLVKGAPAPDFNFTDIHGKQKSLAGFKGKVVYIMVLSSFNIPSMNVMNLLAGLQEHYDHKEVVLLYVSLDTKKEEWEKNVKTYHIAGEQYLPALVGKQNEFSELYNVRNLPQCILIDKEGRIISTNAPNPAQGIEGVMDELLK